MQQVEINANCTQDDLIFERSHSETSQHEYIYIYDSSWMKQAVEVFLR